MLSNFIRAPTTLGRGHRLLNDVCRVKGNRREAMLPVVQRRTSPVCECSTYCPDPSMPRPRSLFPPGETELPPLIHHIRVVPAPVLVPGQHSRRVRSVLETIQAETGMDRAYCSELVDFGCVYRGVVVEENGGGAGGPKTERQRKEGLRFPVKRVVRVRPGEGDREAPPDTYLRVHVNPKHYPLVWNINWPESVIEENGDFIVVDKPSTVPCVPTLDNLHENSMRRLEVGLDLPNPLHAVARLDVCTSGLIVYAKNPAAASALGKKMINREVRKEYLAVTTSRVPVGAIRNLCRKKTFDGVPKPRIYRDFDPTVSVDADGGWQVAELRVMSCDPLPSYAGLYECRLELLTGRTHQIRLQMAARGAVLLGDTRYTPVNGRKHMLRPEDDNVELFGLEPKLIGLQANKLAFAWNVEQRVFNARQPWWRQNPTWVADLVEPRTSRTFDEDEAVSLSSSEL